MSNSTEEIYKQVNLMDARIFFSRRECVEQLDERGRWWQVHYTPTGTVYSDGAEVKYRVKLNKEN